MKDKIVGILAAIIIFLVVSGMLYLAIKYPNTYPGHQLQLPPVYPHYPPIT